MLNRTASVTFASLLTLGLASGAMAEQAKTHTAAAHPRVSEVDRRVANQEHRTAEGVDHGRMDHWQAERDRRRDEWVHHQLRHDEMMHDGHITMGEEHRLNHELDRDAAMRDRHEAMTDGHLALTAQPKVNTPSDPNSIHISTSGQ